MRVRVDGNEVSWDLSRCANLQGVLEEIYRKVGETGRIVGRIEIDGRELTRQEEKEAGDRPLDAVGEVSLATGTVDELFRSSMAGAVTLADAIGKDIGKAVEAYRSGDAGRGQSLYTACIEAMGTFFQLAGGILNGVQSGHFHLPSDAKEADFPPSTETAGILERLLEHQQREDWTAMADLLEYEVAPNLRKWVDFLGTLTGDQAK